MDRRSLLVLLVVNFSLFNARDGRAHAANVLVNPSFEVDAFPDQPPVVGANGWESFGDSTTASTPSAPARSGVGSLRLNSSGGFFVPGALQTFPASPGQLWDLQGYLRVDEPLPIGDTFGLLKIVFNDGFSDLQPAAVTMGQYGSPAFPGIEALPFADASLFVGEWLFAQAQGIAPPGTIMVTFFALFVDQSAGTVYFDDLRAVVIPEPGSVTMGVTALLASWVVRLRRVRF